MRVKGKKGNALAFNGCGSRRAGTPGGGPPEANVRPANLSFGGRSRFARLRWWQAPIRMVRQHHAVIGVKLGWSDDRIPLSKHCLLAATRPCGLRAASALGESHFAYSPTGQPPRLEGIFSEPEIGAH